MNMTKSDVLELRRRLTKEKCTIDRLCGCYVDSSKQILLKFTESFQNLPEEEFFKYLEIARKVLSGSMGGNILELHFARGETGDARQRFLYQLKAGKLEQEESVDAIFHDIIAGYEYFGNYMILLFHDVYDVPARTKDKLSLHDSTEVYEYMLAAICPVELSKPGLSYREEENRVGVTERSWVVGAPEIGFLYPAFADHGTDASAVTYYVKTGKDSHAELVEDVLGCVSQRTAGEEKSAFRSVIEDVYEDPQEGESAFLKVQRQLSGMTLEDPDTGEEQPPIRLTTEALADILDGAKIPEEEQSVIQAAYSQKFGDTPVVAQNVVDQKLVEESVQRLRTSELEDQVDDLKQKLDSREQELTEAKETVTRQQSVLSANGLDEGGNDAEITLHVSPYKARQIHAQMISGVKYLVVPLEKGEITQINGVASEF